MSSPLSHASRDATTTLPAGDSRYEDLLRLFEQAPGFVTFFRGPHHVYELQNAAHARLAEYRDIIGKPVREALPELEGQGFFELLDQVYQSGVPYVGRALPITVKPEGGAPAEERFLDLVYQPIVDDNAAVIGIISQGNDVTEQVQAQAEVRRKQAELEALVEERTRTLEDTRSALMLARQLQTDKNNLLQLFGQAPGFIAVLRGPDHVFELTNESYDRLIAHREVIGKTVRGALPELRGQGFFELLDKVYETGEPFIGFDMEVQVGDPLETTYLDFIYQPLFGPDNKPNGIFVHGNDVTERKLARDEVKRYQNTLETLVAERTQALEETRAALLQSQKLESIGKLTGGVAHDFNNVLQIVGGNLQLLESCLGGNRQAQARLQAAVDAVQRGATLASQLLAFARRQPLRPRVLDLGRSLATFEGLLHQAIGEGVEVHSTVSDGLWRALVDPHLLENAVLNLVLNASDAMQEDGRLFIEIANATLDQQYVATHPDAAAGEYVMLAVTDNGSGMDPAIKERAIEPFFTTKPEHQGTGLGLSMVYGFVKQSGGHLHIDSEPDCGTTVRMYFPRSFAAETEMPLPDSGPAVGGSETILVVEDDKAVQATVVAMLTDLGYSVLKADNGESALAILRSGVSLDLLFTDVVMPGVPRSPELAQMARELAPGIRVLFTSGYTQDVISQGGRLDPGVQLLSKPYGREQLARKLREVLADHAPAAQAAGAPAVPDVPAPAPQASAGTAAARPAGPRRVLVVEDNADAREMVCDVLAAFGYDRDAVATAEEALARLEASPFDVVFSDYILPGMNGVELARETRRRFPHVKVVLTSGYGESLADAHPGQFTVLPKPYELDALQALLDA
ncbi:response regulator [Pseudoduganella sp. GCM10020061]|uniref:response regulator n=1 Tax=Pseudoduganella sp. GCM10020061 TaxID=3317345 RepID=UPI003642CC4E